MASTLTQDRAERNPNPALSAVEMHSSYASPLTRMHSGGMGSSGFKVSNPTTKNSLSPSDLLQYSLVMILNTKAYPKCCFIFKGKG